MVWFSLVWVQELLSSSVSLETSHIIIILINTLLLFFGYVILSYCYRFMKYGKKIYPPYAPGGMIKHMQMTSSPEYPWWILKVATQLENQIFQLSIPPLRPLAHKVIVGDAQIARDILTDPLSTKPIEIYGHFRNVNGLGAAGMFTLNGEEWYKKRKAIAHAFASKHVKRMSNMAIEKTDEWIHSKNDTESFVFDVSNTVLDIVLEAIVESAFEYEMSPNEKEVFTHELELAIIEFMAKDPINPFRSMFAWLIPERKRALQAASRLRELVLKMMDDYTKDKASSTPGSIIQLVMDSDAFSPDDKMAQLLELLIAGHDTTSFSIAWILLSLARHPIEQTKLRESLASLSPNEYSTSRQLKAVVKEGMRLHPVAAAGSIREAGRDFITSRNEIIPKGSICFLPFILQFRNKDIFVEPDKFIPDRWETPSKEMVDALNPFSLGKQNCLGQSLAQAETFSIVARIITKFELSVETEGTVDFFLTLKPVGAILKAQKI